MPEEYTLKPYHIESMPAGAKFNFKLLVKEEFIEDIIEALKIAGTFYGLGGFRSRGYGSVKFDIREEKMDVATKIEQRAEELSQVESTLLLVANSQIILREDNTSIIGFDDTFDKYINKTLQSQGINSTVKPHHDSAKITLSIARGWSLKNQNTLSELIPCIGSGSCVNIEGDPTALATLETYGIGELTNWGYGDVYITGDVE
jgi:CRISPR/Cas system CSM-associated protein Csm3 (group 7 of RAMP superfamily)